MVTSYYDWSAIDSKWREASIFPVISEGAFRATLGILARTVARPHQPARVLSVPDRGFCVTTAFVLCESGLLGAHEVGMLRALSEVGIRSDLVVGTSTVRGHHGRW